MVKYTCPTCLKEFSKKYNFEMHTMNKKKPCQQYIPKNSEIFQNIPKYSKSVEKIEKSDEELNNCIYCEKIFSTRFNLNKHIKNSCKIKKQKDEETTKQNQFLMTQVMELKKLLENQNKQIENQTKEIQEIKRKKPVSKLVINNNTSNNTVNTGSINTNTNNINLMAHGKEDFSKIKLQDVLECLCNENFQDIVPNMVKQIYIDPTYPEFHNFKVLDLARNKSEYYDGKDWVVGKADDGLIKIFENVNTALIEPFDKENINKTIKYIRENEELKKKYKWIDWSKNYCKNLFKDSDKEYMEDRNRILNDLKLIFYNYKDEILKM